MVHALRCCHGWWFCFYDQFGYSQYWEKPHNAFQSHSGFSLFCNVIVGVVVQLCLVQFEDASDWLLYILLIWCRRSLGHSVLCPHMLHCSSSVFSWASLICHLRELVYKKVLSHFLQFLFFIFGAIWEYLPQLHSICYVWIHYAAHWWTCFKALFHDVLLKYGDLIVSDIHLFGSSLCV